jgi:endonuclease V-like protein UPF0215 family
MAVDDGPFRFEDQAALLVGLVVRGKGYLEAVNTSSVSVDRLDATEAVADMVMGSRQHSQLKAILLDGLTLAGFNVVDIEALHTSTGVPVVTVVAKVPDMVAIRQALEDRFPDWEERYRLISEPETHSVVLADGGKLTCHVAGMDPGEARELLRVTTLRGHLPEALRMADLVASGLPRLVDISEWSRGGRQ